LQARGTGDDYANAEAIYKKITEVRPNELNVHLSLGMLYEKTKRKNEAVAEYQIVFDILPEEPKDARDRVSKMMSNVKNGIENTAENLGLTQPASTPPQDNVNNSQSVPDQNPSIPAPATPAPSESIPPAPINLP
jgi:tetratricopeptide (TPR) repeat protein